MIRCSTMKRGLAGAVLVLTAAFYLAGCAVLGVKPTVEEREAAARAREVLARLESQNETLSNFKGIGRIRIRRRGQLAINERLAWIGSLPDRLRIVVLVSGFAAIKMATDGNWLYYYEARGNSPIYKKIRASDASLKRLLDVEIKTSEILTLLAGRVPLRNHHQALLMRNSSSGQEGAALILKRTWQGIVEKICLDESRSRVRYAEFFNRSGKLTYRVRFERMHMLNGYRVPGRLELSNGVGTEVTLDISRLQTDIDVTDSMFSLTPPDR